MIRRFALASAVLIAAASATPAMAGTAASNLDVGANVTSNCSISTAAINFGDYDALNPNPKDGTGSVTITCTIGSAASIKLGQGNNPGAASSDASPLRTLGNGGGDFLSYQIYQDGARSTVWGNTAGTGVSVTGTGAEVTRTVFGRIPPGQNLPAGAYSDTVVAQVAF